MSEIAKTEVRSKPRASDDHGPKAKTPARRSVFRDLFPAEEAAELEIRCTLLNGLEHWLASSGVIIIVDHAPSIFAAGEERQATALGAH